MTTPLSAEQTAHTQHAMTLLANRIRLAKGALSFAQFMQFALYEPGAGYYTSGNEKLGPNGDFTTAPLISPLFSACLGNYCVKHLSNLPNSDILELGAGTGHMAIGILEHLAEQNTLPNHYLILEPSAELQQRQSTHLKTKLPPELFKHVRWLNTLPDDNHFTGIILANEVVDAMPIERVCWQHGQWWQQHIALEANTLSYTNHPITNPLLQAAVNKLPRDLEENYLTEVNPWLHPWMQSLSACLKQGNICLIDYGFPRETYYHPERQTGTLMCHFQHRAHHDPLQYLGLQDITAHVDFTALGEAAQAANLNVIRFSNQTQFLIDCGLTELLSAVTNRNNYEQLLPGVKQLTLPQEMGELVKVIELEKNASET